MTEETIFDRELRPIVTREVMSQSAAARHTPEPWNYTQEGKDAFGIVEPDGTSILHMQALENSTGAHHMEANVRRIVAAVNACARIPIGELELLRGNGLRDVVVMHQSFADRFDEVIKERDELLAIVKSVSCHWPDADLRADPDLHVLVRRSRAAIAKCAAPVEDDIEQARRQV